MARQKLPDFKFERGICVLRSIPGMFDHSPRTVRKDWTIIGRLDDGLPFMFMYRNSITNWFCEQQLGLSLRKKILNTFREEVRCTDGLLPGYIVMHDLQMVDQVDINAGHTAAAAIEDPFYNDVWRSEYLDDRDEDYVVLSVPYAEKDEVAKLGAKFNGNIRKWWVKRADDMTAFAKWISA